MLSACQIYWEAFQAAIFNSALKKKKKNHNFLNHKVFHKVF